MAKGKLIVITLILIIVIPVVIISIFYKSSRGSKTNQVTTEYYTDPNNGNVVAYTQDKTPESFGSTNEQKTIFLGAEVLLDKGVTISQLDTFKYLTVHYFTSQNKTPNEVSIVSDSVRFLINSPDTAGAARISFRAQINRTDDYDMYLDFSDDNSVKLFIFNPTQMSPIYVSEKQSNLVL